MDEDLTGKLPTHQELSEWVEPQYLSFLSVCRHFIAQTPKGPKWHVTRENWEAAALSDDADFVEVMERINIYPAQEGATEKKFYYKFQQMVRLVLGYLRDHPDRITPSMREIMQPNGRLNWCLVQPVIARPLDLQERIASVYEKTVDVVYMLADSITAQEIESMTPKEKLLAMGRLNYVYGIRKDIQPRRSMIPQLNVRTASVKELEAELLRFSRRE